MLRRPYQLLTIASIHLTILPKGSNMQIGFPSQNFRHWLAFFSISGMLLMAGIPAIAQQSPLPWLAQIDPSGQRSSIETVATAAAVSVSDGLTYDTETLFHDHQRAIFKRIYSDRTVTQGVEGQYAWSFDGQAETEAGNFIKSIVLGHQFHAQLLFFDQLHKNFGTPAASAFDGRDCRVISAEADDGKYSIYYHRKSDLPLAMEIIPEGAGKIIIRFKDWQKAGALHLPYTILIDDGSRQFEYRYTKIAFNEGSLADYRAPDEVLSEEQRLLRAHRRIMDSHFFERIEDMAGLQGDSIVVVSRGEIFQVSGKDSEARLASNYKNRNHFIYDDMVRPIVQVSDDGTLGWVIVQVKAFGERYAPDGSLSGPLDFVCAWIELYQKDDGQWRSVGNVSNFKQ